MKVSHRSVLEMLKRLFWAVCLFFGAYIGFENAVYAKVCFLPSAANNECETMLYGPEDKDPRGGMGDQGNPSDPSNPGNSCAGYNDTLKDVRCWTCTACPSDNTKYNCTQKSGTGYVLNGNECIQDPCDESYNQDSALDAHCYDCEKCSYNYSARRNKYKCDEKADMSDYEINEGTCRLKPGANCSGALETEVVSAHGQDWNNCYDAEVCSDVDGKTRYSLTAKSVGSFTLGWYVDGNGQCASCDGYYCGVGKTPSGELVCTDGNGSEYYQACITPAQCLPQDLKVTVTLYNAQGKPRQETRTCKYVSNENLLNPAGFYASSVYYKAYECTAPSGNVYKYGNDIYANSYDCMGNRSPLYGKVPCRVDGNGCLTEQDTPYYKYDGYFWCNSCDEGNEPLCYSQTIYHYFTHPVDGRYFKSSGDTFTNENGKCQIARRLTGGGIDWTDANVRCKGNLIPASGGGTQYERVGLYIPCYEPNCLGVPVPVSRETYPYECKTNEMPPAGASNVGCGNYTYSSEPCVEKVNACLQDECYTRTKEAPYDGYNACRLLTMSQQEASYGPGYEHYADLCRISTAGCGQNNYLSYQTSCTSKGLGCDGNPTPYEQGYNIKGCEEAGGFSSVDPITCGGVKYYKDCFMDCTSWIWTQEQCLDAGGQFEDHCTGDDENHTHYGDCTLPSS